MPSLLKICVLGLAITSTVLAKAQTGIGTIAPDSRVALHVRAQGAQQPIRLEGLATGTTEEDVVVRDADGILYYRPIADLTVSGEWQDDPTSTYIYALRAEAAGNDIVVTDNGRLGILTTTPSQALQVRGKVLVGEGGTQAAPNEGVVRLGYDNALPVTDLFRGVQSYFISDWMYTGQRDLGGGRYNGVTMWGDDVDDDYQFIHYNSAGAGSERPMLHLDGEDLFVGIGTVTPSAKLHVVGDAIVTSMTAGDLNGTADDDRVVTRRQSDGLLREVSAADLIQDNGEWRDHSSGTYIFADRANQNGQRVVVSDDGELGIGTTNPLNDLHVATSGILLGNDIDGAYNTNESLRLSRGGTSDGIITVQDGSGRFNFKWNATYGSGERFLANGDYASKLMIGGFANNDPDGIITADGDVFRVGTSTVAGTAGNAISWTYPFTIENTGEVGIGTTNPSARMHVDGSIKFDLTDIPVGAINNVPATDPQVLLLNPTNDEVQRIPAFSLFDQEGEWVDQGTYIYARRAREEGSVDQVVVDDDGEVGLGTTNPQEKLHLNGGGIRIDGQTYGISFNNEEPFSSNPTRDGSRIYHENATFGTWRDALVIEKTDVNNADVDGGIVFANRQRDDNRFSTMVIRGDGDVGIGRNLNNPTERFHVLGNGLFQEGGVGTAADQGLVKIVDDVVLPAGYERGVQVADNSEYAYFGLEDRSTGHDAMIMWGNGTAQDLHFTHRNGGTNREVMMLDGERLNLGIGGIPVGNAAIKLDVYGRTRVRDLFGQSGDVDNSGSDDRIVSVDANGDLRSVAASDLFQDFEDEDWVISGNDIYNANSRAVGIGVTSGFDANYTLDIGATTRVRNGTRFQFGNQAANSITPVSDDDVNFQTRTRLNFRDRDGTVNIMTVRGDRDNLGIGTNDPDANYGLDVAVANTRFRNNSDLQFGNQATNRIFATGDDDVDFQARTRLSFLDRNGNVDIMTIRGDRDNMGIGTNDPGTGFGLDVAVANTRFRVNSDLQFGNNAANRIVGISDNEYHIQNRTELSFRNRNNNADIMTVRGDRNNVGIRTNDPNTAFGLDIAADVRLRENEELRFGNNAQNRIIARNDNEVDFQTRSSLNFLDRNGNVDIMTIRGDRDNLGIRTNDPNGAFGMDINADVRMRQGEFIQFGNQGENRMFASGNEDLRIRARTRLSFRNRNDNGDVMTVRADQTRVGIRTNAPSTDFDVNGRARVRDLPNGNATTDLYVTADANGNLRQVPLTSFQGPWTRNGAQTVLNNVLDEVGIGTISPESTFHIFEPNGTAPTNRDGTILLEHGDIGGESSIVFKSRQNENNDFGFISYSDDGSGNGTSAENSLLRIGTGNDGPGNNQDDIAFMASGHVGIGTIAPTRDLDIDGQLRVRNVPELTGASIDPFALTVDVDGNVNKADISAIRDNLGNHIATENIELVGNTLSYDKTNAGLRFNPNNSAMLSGRLQVGNFSTAWINETITGITNEGFAGNDGAIFAPVYTGGESSDLRLYITDNPDDQFSIWGDPCAGGDCGDINSSSRVIQFFAGGDVDVARLAHGGGNDLIVLADASGTLKLGPDPTTLAGSAGAADNLGNHTATTNLIMGNNRITRTGAASEGFRIDPAGNIDMPNGNALVWGSVYETIITGDIDANADGQARDLRFEARDDIYFMTRDIGGTQGDFIVDSDGRVIARSDEGMRFHAGTDNTNDDFRFYTDSNTSRTDESTATATSTERFVIENDGDVKINGLGGGGDQLVFVDNTGTLFANTGSSDGLWDRDAPNAETFLRNTGDDVGIGTADPSAALHVYRDLDDASGPAEVRIQNRNGGGQSALFFQEGTSTTEGIRFRYDGSDNDLYLERGNGDVYATFERNGDVGFGTNDPQTQLHVVRDNAIGGSGAGLTNMARMRVQNLTTQGSAAIELMEGTGGIGNNNGMSLRYHSTADGTENSFEIVRGASNQADPNRIYFRIDRNSGETTVRDLATGGANEMVVADANGVLSTEVIAADLWSRDAGNAETFLANNGDEVGIGTTDPTAKLDVNGAARIRSLLAGGAADEIVVADANGNLGTIARNSFDSPWDRDATNGTYLADLSDFVGIGTSAPARELEVVGDVRVSSLANATANPVAVTADANGDLSLLDLSVYTTYWDRDAVNSETILANNGDEVGVGTADPTAKLDVNGEVRIRSFGVGTGSDELVVTDANGNLGTISQSMFDSPWERDATNGTYLANLGDAVGVGTATPATEFHVVGTTRISTLAGAGTRIVTADGNGDLASTSFDPYISYWNRVTGGSQNYVELLTGTDFIGIGTTGTPSAQLHTTGTVRFEGLASPGEVVVTDASGNLSTQALATQLWDRDAGNGYTFTSFGSDDVGIGTSTPVSKLHVASGNVTINDLVSNTGDLATDRVVVSTTGGELRSLPVGSLASPWLEDGTEVTLANNDNFVGIGTQSPLSVLHIEDNLPNSGLPMELRMQNRNNNGVTQIRFRTGSNASGFNDENNSMVMRYTNQFDAFEIANGFVNGDANFASHLKVQRNNGRVGINVGTAVPQQQLDVVGNQRLDGNLFFEDQHRIQFSETNSYLRDDGNNTNTGRDGDVVLRAQDQLLLRGGNNNGITINANGTLVFQQVPVVTSTGGRRILVMNGTNVQQIDPDDLDGPWARNGTVVTLSNSGDQVGIGANPGAGYKLDVNGDTRVRGGLRVNDLSGTGSRMVVANGAGDLATQAIPVVHWELDGSGNSIQQVDPTREVGIGGAANTGVALTVNGSTRISNLAGSGTQQVTVDNLGNLVGSEIAWTRAAGQVDLATGSDNVAIGIGTATERLHIDGNIQLENGHELKFADANSFLADAGTEVQLSGNAGLQFATSGTNRASIDATGNFSIGSLGGGPDPQMMVVADAAGVLSTQAIPAGGGSEWTRTGTTLSPTTAGDDVLLAGTSELQIGSASNRIYQNGAALELNSATRIDLFSAGAVRVGTSAAATSLVVNNVQRRVTIGVGTPVTAAGGPALHVSPNTGDLALRVEGLTDAGAGTYQRLLVNASGEVYRATGTVTEAGRPAPKASDARLKDVTRPLEGVLDVLDELSAIEFTYKQDDPALVAAHGLDKRGHYGVIAQEVQEHFPHAVEEVDGYLHVDYEELVGVLLGATKELTDRNSNLEEQLYHMMMEKAELERNMHSMQAETAELQTNMERVLEYIESNQKVQAGGR